MARTRNRLLCGRYLGLLPAPSLTSNASTPMHEAAIGGNVEVLALLYNDAERSRNTKYLNGWSQEGDSVLRCNVDDRDANKRTALLLAAMYGRAAAAVWLLRANAYLYAADDRGNTALHYAVEKRHTDLIRLLSNYDGDLGLLSRHYNFKGETPAQKALKQAAVGSALASKIRETITSFWQLCFEGRISEVEKRLTNGWNSPNDVSARGWLPLHFAACGSNVRLVRILMSLGTAVEVLDGQGIGADGKSVRLRYPELKRADCDVTLQDLKDWKLLFKNDISVRRKFGGNQELDEEKNTWNHSNRSLSESFVENLNAKTKDEDLSEDEEAEECLDQPLHIAAACNQNLIVRTLIREAGVRIDARGNGLALFGLGLLDSPEALTNVNDHSQPGAVNNPNSTTPHRFAASPQNSILNERSHFGLSKLSPSRNSSTASSPSKSKTILCSSHPTKEALRYVSKLFRGATPLIVAAKFGAETSAGELVNQGTDLRCVDMHRGDTALHIAVRRGDVEVILEIVGACGDELDDIAMLEDTLKILNKDKKSVLDVYMTETKRRIHQVEKALYKAFEKVGAEDFMKKCLLS